MITAVVNPSTGCWIWQRGKSSTGYGMVNHGGRVVGAHRMYYELLVGPIPNGLEIDHLCRVRACVNPDHMEPVTRAENVRRGTSSPLTWEKVREIRRSVGPAKSLAAKYGVHVATIYAVWGDASWARADDPLGPDAVGAEPDRSIRPMSEQRCTRREQIAGMYLNGLSLADIAAVLDSSANAINVELVAMRQDGWDIPYRYRMENGKRLPLELAA